MKPDLLICDEIVSALDVSIQGQILNLLLDIRSRHSLSFLFIAHDLKAASYFCDRIGVMYRGELMEEAAAADLYQTARHPYTRLLFSSVAGPAGEGGGPPAGSAGEPAGKPAGKRETLKGEIRTPVTEILGCAFADRCPLADGRCRGEPPPVTEAETGHVFYCWKT
jgi:oligopeptide/dipeptide ABC transporter ATP-binding protein